MYIMDTDTFVNSHRLNYPFDLFPTYWDKIALFSTRNLIAINSSIYQELASEKEEAEKDILQKWVEDEFKGQVYEQDPVIVSVWVEIINHIRQSNHYKDEALSEWADESIADPWIIATAKAHDLTVVTNEQRNSGLNSKYPTKNAKIPDICDDFDVPCISLQTMLRKLGFRL